MSADSSLAIVYNSSLVILAVIIFLSNLVVLLAFLKTPHLHNQHNVFVASMALADTAVGVLSVPLRIISSSNMDLSFNECLWMNYISLAFLDMSIFMLLGMTVDRLFAIRYPFQYEHFETKHAVIAVGLLWTLGLSLAFLPEWMAVPEMREKYDNICNFGAVISPMYLFYVRFLLLFMTSLIIMIVINTYTLSVVHRHKNDIRRTTLQAASMKQARRDYKAEKMTIMMIAAFVLCHSLLNIQDAVWYFTGIAPDQNSHRLRIFKLVYLSESFLNPMIYAYSNSKIFEAIKSVMFCRPIRKEKTYRNCRSNPRSIVEQRRTTKQRNGDIELSVTPTGEWTSSWTTTTGQERCEPNNGNHSPYSPGVHSVIPSLVTSRSHQA